MNNFSLTVVEGHLLADPSENQFTIKVGHSEFEDHVKVFTTGKLSETCQTYLKKGSRVLVSGRASFSEGGVHAKDINFLGAKK